MFRAVTIHLKTEMAPPHTGMGPHPLSMGMRGISILIGVVTMSLHVLII